MAGGEEPEQGAGSPTGGRLGAVSERCGASTVCLETPLNPGKVSSQLEPGRLLPLSTAAVKCKVLPMLLSRACLTVWLIPVL